MIPFNRPPYTGNEDAYVLSAMRSDKMCGDGEYGRRCQEWFERHIRCSKALLTPSCTHALEMAALLIDIQPGDEVIMPSYTFVSTANAFALRGAKIVFVDIKPDTMNINASLIQSAITKRTRAIVPVHYAGVGCDMAAIMEMADFHKIYVVEDAAQAMMSSYKSKHLGAIGHLSAYSFHETKNFTSGGEGGLLLVNDERFMDRAEIIREKGTNRSQFFRGMVDKYSWVDLGSSYLLSDIQAAYLWGQLEKSEEISKSRLAAWHRYLNGLRPLEKAGLICLPHIPSECEHNGHIFYIKAKHLEQRSALLSYLLENGVYATFHYIPLHSSYAGRKYSRFHGEDNYTTAESDKLIRLPMFYGLKFEEIDYVVNVISDYFS